MAGWRRTTERSVAPATTRVADAAPGVAEPGQTQLEGRLRAGVDRQLVGPDAERLGEHRACGVEERPGPPTRRMQPGGIGQAASTASDSVRAARGWSGPREASRRPAAPGPSGEGATLRR